MIDLSPWNPAVPEAVVSRIAEARRVLAVGHENPDADTIGSTLAVCRLVRACGGTATPVFARSGFVRKVLSMNGLTSSTRNLA